MSLLRGSNSMLKSVRLASTVAARRQLIPQQQNAFKASSRFYSTNGDEKKTADASSTEASSSESKQEATDAPAATPAEEALAAKEKQLAEVKDAYLRCLADMENLRARTRKEVDNTKDYAIQKFAKDLLDTADILTMAIKNVPAEELTATSTNTHLKTLHTGVEMTREELLKTMKRYGVESFDPMNEKFDPNLHQANFQVPMPGKEPGTVFDVQKIGFMIKGRVLRPAQVGVVQATS